MALIDKINLLATRIAQEIKSVRASIVTGQSDFNITSSTPDHIDYASGTVRQGTYTNKLQNGRVYLNNGYTFIECDLYGVYKRTDDFTRDGTRVPLYSVSMTGYVIDYIKDHRTAITLPDTSAGTPALAELFGVFTGPITGPITGTIPTYLRANVTLVKISAWASANVTANTTAILKKNGVQVASITVNAGTSSANAAISVAIAATDALTMDITAGTAPDLTLRLDY